LIHGDLFCSCLEDLEADRYCQENSGEVDGDALDIRRSTQLLAKYRDRLAEPHKGISNSLGG
jgi:hypothetical protein